MGPLRFDIDYKKNVSGLADRKKKTATFKGRANDAVFVFYTGQPGEYIRFQLADPASRIALRNTTRIAAGSPIKSTDAIRVDHGSFAELHIRRQLGLSLGGGLIFGKYDIAIQDAGPDPAGGGTFIGLSIGGGPGGDRWVVEC
jgi:hypothetical protein